MKILFLSEALSPHIGRWHAAFEKMGWEATTASCDFDEKFQGRKLLSGYQKGPPKYLSIVDQIKELVRNIQPHVVNAHFLPSYGLAAALAKVHPFVLNLWGSDILVSGSRSPLHKFRSSFVLKRADLVVADADCLINEAEKIVPLKRRLVVSFGVKKLWYESGQARRLQDLSILRIFSCRNFEPLYDVATLIRAARMLADEGFLFHLTLAGSGSLQESLVALAKELNLGQHVRFAGYLNEEQLFTEYRNNDVYVSTALSDSTSVSLLEALTQKLYPVVADLPGNREWLNSPQYLFRPGDAAELATKIKLGLNKSSRERAYEEYEPVLKQKGIREEQMRIADLTFRKLIDEYHRQ